MRNKFLKYNFYDYLLKIRQNHVILSRFSFFFIKNEYLLKFLLSNRNVERDWRYECMKQKSTYRELVFMNNRGILFGQREEDIVSLRNLFRSTVSGKVFHLFLLASSTIQFKEAGKGRRNILIGKYFKNDIFIVYIYIMKFLCLIKEILFSLRQTFCYNSSLSRLNSTLDFVRGVGGFKANLNWSYYVRKKVLKKS